MGYSLSYHRPGHVSSSARSSVSSSCSILSDQKSIGSTYMPIGVPSSLSFDRILAGQTSRPCTLRDFMNHLVYIEHSAENLQFFLWYRDFLFRFSKIPSTEKALSPLWLNDRPDPEHGKKSTEKSAAALEKIAASTEALSPPVGALPNFDMTLELDETNNEKQGAVAPAMQCDAEAGSTVASSSKRNTDFRRVTSDAFESHNIVAPFTIQPYREEITRIIATYIAEGAPRELNISAKERANLLHALATTTHPSAFGRVAASVETTLRHQSHPNFIRYCIQNADNHRIAFCTWLGTSSISIGLVIALMLTLSSAGRGWRAFSAIPFIFGITTLTLGLRGICAVLNMFLRCHVQPWELFDDEPDDTSVLGGSSKNSFDSFGSANSWEDQPWVSKYERMSLIRKIFNRETRVNEEALRHLHRTMLLQAAVVALPITIVLEAIFLSVPKGNFF